MGFRQFRPRILSLQKQTNTVRAGERLGVGQEQGQGGQRPGRHHIEGLGRQGLDAGILDRELEAHALGGSGKEGALLSGGFMKRDGDLWPHRCQYQAGEPGTGTQISEVPGSRWDQGLQLGGIQEMAVPEIGQGAAGHQIVVLVPGDQQIGISLEPGQCFT